MSTQPKPRLGRGISSLISNSAKRPGAIDGQYHPETQTEDVSASPAADSVALDVAADPVGRPLELPLDDIAPNPFQPRREFRDGELAELAASIAQQGVLQPLIVVRNHTPGAEKPYSLIAGERRLRASGIAGLASVPCVVRDATRQQMLEWALVENIQRSDLNPIERAQAFREYMDRFSLTQAEAGERLGQARATLANYLRLLDLPAETQESLRQGLLSFGHAKVLAGLAADPQRQVRLTRGVIAQSWSVRELERRVEEALKAEASPTGEPAASPGRAKAPYVRDLEERLTQAIGTRVNIRPGRTKNSGRIVVDYYNLEDFDRISALLGLPEDA
jgi:ParB family transcriptional regulator, chromosome partitioning protein